MSNSLFLSLIILLLLVFTTGQSQEAVSGFEDHKTLKDQSFIHSQWKSIGPTLNSARVESIQGVPGKPGHFYAAFGSGNCWKTTNNGQTWVPIFEGMPVQGIGDIALAPSDPNIIYLGSGESLRKQRNFTFPGNGIYRSDNDGEKWRHLGLDSSWHIAEIAVHPNDPDLVLVAVMGKFWTPSTYKGIYRSTNGGLDWEHVLYVDETTRANDIVFPSATRRLYTQRCGIIIRIPACLKVYVARKVASIKVWTAVRHGRK